MKWQQSANANALGSIKMRALTQARTASRCFDADVGFCAAGDAARTSGKVVASMTSGLLQFNKKHDISGKTASFLKAGATKVSEINTKYHVTENVGNATKTAVGVVKDTNEKCVAITHREGGAGMSIDVVVLCRD